MTCYKNTYRRKRAAKTAGKVLRRQTGRDVYVYECAYCRGWHLTTTPLVDKRVRNRTHFDIAA